MELEYASKLLLLLDHSAESGERSFHPPPHGQNPLFLIPSHINIPSNLSVAAPLMRLSTHI